MKKCDLCGNKAKVIEVLSYCQTDSVKQVCDVCLAGIERFVLRLREVEIAILKEHTNEILKKYYDGVRGK